MADDFSGLLQKNGSCGPGQLVEICGRRMMDAPDAIAMCSSSRA